ncbi:MAG: DUF2760 domain-containing protein [Planctomycetota bacterium]
MSRIGLAVRAFWRALTQKSFGRALEALLHGEEGATLRESPAGAKTAPAKPAATLPRGAPSRGRTAEGAVLSLLALLQREARLVDFLMESLSEYSDAQVGAAVREVHRGCASVLERVFGLKPVEQAQEGEEMTVPEGFDASALRLTGNVTGKPPYRGVLRHHGWKATRCDVPARRGSEEELRVVAPAEVELR